MKISKRSVLLLFALSGALLYLCMTTFVPGLSIWSYSKNINSSENNRSVKIKEGQIFESDFQMPFERINGIIIPISTEGSSYVTKLDADMYLYNSEGILLVQKNITSAYDSECHFLYEQVDSDSDYRLILKINSVTDSEQIPSLSINDNGEPVFILKGCFNGAPGKIIFALIYFAVLSAYMVTINYASNNINEQQSAISEKILLAIALFMSAFLLSQYYDLFMIIKSALRMLDSFKNGTFRDYYGFSYLQELQHDSSKMYFAYEYDFFSIFPVAILFLPMSGWLNGEITYGFQGDIAVCYLSLIIVAFLFLCAKIITMVADECGMEKHSKKAVRDLFIFSPLVIYVSVLSGQIDLMYILVILLALYFYYRKRYYIFSAIFSFAIAMKTLPIMIFIPLVLLANKKIRDIFINIVIGCSATVISALIFENGDGHHIISRIIAEDYSYIDRITAATISNSIPIFVVLFALILIAAYFFEVDNNDKRSMLYWSMLSILCVYTIFYITVDWHKQWLIPLMVAIAFLIPLCKESRKLIMLTGFFELFFILYTGTKGNSIYMVNYGILNSITSNSYHGASLNIIADNISAITTPVIHALSAACLLYINYLIIRERELILSGQEICKRSSAKTYNASRIGILIGIILFYLWCYWYIG